MRKHEIDIFKNGTNVYCTIDAMDAWDTEQPSYFRLNPQNQAFIL